MAKMKMTTAEKVLASSAILLVSFLMIAPLAFRDPVADWKVYFSPQREKEFNSLARRMLEREDEVIVDPSADRSRKSDFSTNVNSELQSELSRFLTSNGLEYLLVKPGERLVELGSYRPRRWSIYSFHENGKPSDDRFKSIEAISTNWYYCEW